MSRCFPYPPPGFEKKPKRDQEDLLAKEKHKDKKHKKDKDKKEKEKREDKNGKDRSKDKHKEKKDRKEKHRDKKKDKEREKDKSRASDDQKTAEEATAYHEQKNGESSQRAEEIKDSLFTQELCKRIRDDEKVASSRMVENFPSSTQKKADIIGAGAAYCLPVQKRLDDLGTGDGSVRRGFEAMETGSTNPGFIQKRNDKQSAGVAVVGSLPRRVESTGAKAASSALLSKGIEGTVARTSFPGSAQQKSRNEAVPREISSNASSQKRTEGFGIEAAIRSSAGKNAEGVGAGASMHGLVQERIGYADTGMEKAGSLPKRKEITSGGEAVHNFVNAAERKYNGTCSPMGKDKDRGIEAKEKVKNDEQKRMVATVSAPATAEKGRPMAKETGPNFAGAEEGSHNNKMGKPVPMEECVEKKIEVNKKSNEDTDRHRDKDREKRRKEKDKTDRKKDKEERRLERKLKRMQRDKTKDAVERESVDSAARTALAVAHVDTEKNTVAHVDTEKNTVAGDGQTKKRKHFETNGFLHENDARPNKLPRPAPSLSPHPSLENGRIPGLNHNATPTSISHGALHNIKAEKLLEHRQTNNEHKGERVPPPDSKPSAATTVGTGGNGEASTRPPHSNAKYLGRIYSVPQVEEVPQYDDQEWLLGAGAPRPKPKLEDDGTPEVWSQVVVLVGSPAAGVIAMPYVIPF